MPTVHASTPRTDHSTAEPPGSTRNGVLQFASVGELVKFAAVAGVMAMVADAVFGHGLLWQNDPYWTYWVTDTLLITTVFSLGTAVLGASVARGAAVAAVQVLVLTTYYWSLSPIGLPSSPEWLDLQHTWVTGLPVHFGVYYLGYLVALWLWRRRTGPRSAEARPDYQPNVRRDAVGAAVTALAVVVSVGLVQTVVIGEFPGVTWFVMRTVILMPFTLGWWALAGRDRGAALAGGMVAAVLLIAYGHYLGPIGLPDTDLRVLAQDPPPTDLHWLSYTEEFLVMGPLTVGLAVAVFLLASRWHGHRWSPVTLEATTVVASAVVVVVVVAAGVATARAVDSAERTTTVTSVGVPDIAAGATPDADAVAAEGELRFTATQNNTRRTPLPPHDAVDLAATVVHPDGTRYEITSTDVMVDEPAGRFTTWAGVGFDKWHHGRSGIGTSQIDATRSEVAVNTLADLRVDDALVATRVPVRAFTVDGAGVELHVGASTAPVPELPDGHLRITWDDREGDSPEAPERARNALGGTVLVGLIAAALAAGRNADTSRSQPRDPLPDRGVD